MKHNLFKKFMSFSIGNWLGLLVSVISTPIITRLLPPDDFGKASMFTLALNLIVLISLTGTDQAFVRFFYEEKEENRKYLFLKCIIISFGVCLFFSLLIILFSDVISEYLFGETNKNSIILLVLNIFLQILNRYVVLVVRMQQKGLVFSLLQLCSKIIDFIGVVSLIYLIGKSYTVIIYSQLINSLIVTILALFFIKEFLFKNAQNNTYYTKYSIKDITNFGIPLVFTSIITWLFQSIDRVALKQSSFEQLGLYVAAFKIIAILNIIQISFSTFWAPVCYERYEKNPNDKGFFEKVHGLISLSMYTIGILTIVFKDFISYLLGPGYREASKIMPFLVFIPMMYTISETTVIGINFARKTKFHILIAIASCLVNIIGCIILVPKFGAAGAAISTGLAYIVFYLVRTLISQKYYYVNYRVKKSMLVILLLTIYALYNTFYYSNIFNFVTGIAILIFIIYVYKDLLKRTIDILM